VAEPAKPLRGLENAGKPGHYTVQRGDTLVRIALDHGQNWRDLARWNNIDNPNLIEVGEVLRVTPPAEGVVARPIAPPVVQAQPLPPQAARPAPAAPAAAPPVAPAPAAASTASADDLVWAWPAQGQTVGGFDEAKNKGIDIAGHAGDAVLAAADGRVVYAGSGLRGYGNLIILKHNNTYLTAYAHNQSLLVKEDQTVRQGQKIAEMGSTDADRVKLHFEIRRQGKPVDPARYLPPR
jgi:lipoprotein NlpD